MLPSITNVINLADSHDRAAFAMATHIKQEPRERENSETKEEVSYLQIIFHCCQYRYFFFLALLTKQKHIYLKNIKC